MAVRRSIEIDLEVHNLIESNRMSSSDTPNDVLRRLLGLGGQAAEGAEGAEPKVDAAVEAGAWSDRGVVLPSGTQLRMSYNDQTDFGEIREGAWWVHNTRYDNPSGAAGAVALTRTGAPAKLDGWRYWQVKMPGDTGWTPLMKLRGD